MSVTPFFHVATYSGAISGIGSILKLGDGLVKLAGANGVPGIAPRPDNLDTAAFSGSRSVTTIDLSGENPSMKGLSFSGSDYTLTGGSLTLKSDTGTAVVTVSAGTQTIQSRLTLASSAEFAPISGATMLLDGDIDGAGALSVTDSGTLVLGGSNSYSGGTFVEAGLLIVASDSALADGTSLTVGNAGAFAGLGLLLRRRR